MRICALSPRLLQLTAAAVMCLVASRIVAAPVELPDWQYGSSIYQSISAKATAAEVASSVRKAPQPTNEAVSAAHTSADSPDGAVVLAGHSEQSPPSPERSPRHLAPLEDAAAIANSESSAPPSVNSPLSQLHLPMGTVYSTAAALAIVIGLFLLCMWLLRRGSRRSTFVLPGEVVSVVGRVPIAARQFAELLRVGNKLVLVSRSPAGANSLTEVTDPAEVNRLLGLCQQYDPHSTTRAFEDVFRQLSREPYSAGRYLDGPAYGTTAPPEPSYRALRREARDA